MLAACPAGTSGVPFGAAIGARSKSEQNLSRGARKFVIEQTIDL